VEAFHAGNMDKKSTLSYPNRLATTPSMELVMRNSYRVAELQLHVQVMQKPMLKKKKDKTISNNVDTRKRNVSYNSDSQSH
jgi:hypothetical protein